MQDESVSHGGRWSNRTYNVPALCSLLSTCQEFWYLRSRDIGYTRAMFSPESMYITLDSSACTSYPSLKRHKCIWRFGKAIGLHQLVQFLLSQYFFSSHTWHKNGITKKPLVVYNLAMFKNFLLALLLCTLSLLMPGVDNFCCSWIHESLTGELKPV
jgi:hypothetical protein